MRAYLPLGMAPACLQGASPTPFKRRFELTRRSAEVRSLTVRAFLSLAFGRRDCSPVYGKTLRKLSRGTSIKSAICDTSFSCVQNRLIVHTNMRFLMAQLSKSWAMKRAVLYLRVSTIDQTTANQEGELREIAGKMGCEITK